MTDNNLVFVDSNYFIALFNSSDALHEQAKELAKRIAKEESILYISNYVELEILTVLSQRVGRAAANAAANILSDDQHIKRVFISEELHSSSLQTFRVIESKNISLVDCSILVTLKYTGIKKLLTFDITNFKPLREQFNFSIVG